MEDSTEDWGEHAKAIFRDVFETFGQLYSIDLKSFDFLFDEKVQYYHGLVKRR